MAEILLKIKDAIHRNSEKDKHCYKEGDIVDARSIPETQRLWFELLVRGTHGIEDIPFIPELYTIYFERIVVDSNGRQRIDENPKCNFRKANRINRKQKNYDRQIVSIPAILNQEHHREIMTYFSCCLKEHAFSEEKIYNTWPWGRKERLKFLPVYIPDMDFPNIAMIRELKQPLMQMIKDEIFMTAQRRYAIYWRKNTAVREALKLDVTVKDLMSTDIPIKIKNHLRVLVKKGTIKPTNKIENIIDNFNVELFTRFDVALKLNSIVDKSK